MKNKTIISRAVYVRSAMPKKTIAGSLVTILNAMETHGIRPDKINEKTGEIEISLEPGLWVDYSHRCGMYHAMAMVDDELVTLVVSPDAKVVAQVIGKHLNEVQQ